MSHSKSLNSDLNGMILGGVYVSPEHLTCIFQHLKSRDLIQHCSLVCHSWLDIVRTLDLWIRKIKRKQVVIPQKLRDHTLDWRAYASICSKNPFGRNLIKNPCGMPGSNPLMYWTIKKNGGDKWKVECPPVSCDPVLELEGVGVSSSCFVTSYYTNRKEQTVSLLQEGLTPELLDTVQPLITVSEWYAARFDCGAFYKLKVLLLDKHKKEMENGIFTYKWEEQQWLGKQWHKVEHTFKDYGRGVRHVLFIHEGRDTQFWAGWYGSKMTGATVKVSVEGSLEPKET